MKIKILGGQRCALFGDTCFGVYQLLLVTWAFLVPMHSVVGLDLKCDSLLLVKTLLEFVLGHC